MSKTRNFGEFRSIVRSFSIKPAEDASKKTIQVCILGADTPTGLITSFLLKQNPMVSQIHLQGTSRVENLGVDLSHFDTNCRVQTYADLSSASKAVKSADVILLLGLESAAKNSSPGQLVMAEGPRVRTLAEICSKFAPKALLVVGVTPISVTLPMVRDIYKQGNWYHPGRLLGSVALPQVKANAIAGYYQNLDPQIVHVPIIGGPDLDSALPLFSKTTPIGISEKDAKKLVGRFREASGLCSASQAFGLNRMVTTLALGLCGDDDALVSAFVRSNLVTTCGHMVSMVQIDKSGVAHNHGLPRLSKAELAQFEEASILLKIREEMAAEFLASNKECGLPAFIVREMEEEQAAKEGVVR